MAYYEGGFCGFGNGVGQAKSLAAAGYSQEGLVFVARPDALIKLFDSLGLVVAVGANSLTTLNRNNI